MDSKTLLVVVSMLYFIDISNAITCYNCTQFELPACGETLADTTNIPTATCEGKCSVTKSTFEISPGNPMTMYVRQCSPFCGSGCNTIEGTEVCMNCCTTDQCNINFMASPTGGNGGDAGGAAAPEPTQPAAKDATPTSSAINVVVNFATILFTSLLSTTMF